ncbi:MAG: hypothetical protein OHM56_10380 [Spiroplasma phoeniceum]|nr:MAG: hypothetical protein OHM57_09795 [Spiroplasma phoeniceum]UZQ33627.1 MAG: hypothetical protein OHM56_10380 [Spiroplasma phoeniceum]
MNSPKVLNQFLQYKQNNNIFLLVKLLG